MTKHLASIITSLTVLVFITACQQPAPEPFEPPKAEPAKVEPQKAEPAKAEPAKAKPAKAKPTKPEPPPAVSFHDKCAYILTNFVDDNGRVDYKTLKRKKLQLKKLLDEFEKLDPNQYESWPKEDKIAFWINAYNIQLLEIIVDNYPIESYRILRVLPGWGPDSIRHIDKRIGGIQKQKFIVMNEEFTLSEIEQRFFRKEFGEPRVFFAISYATLSSPPLRNEPYYGHKLANQLDDQAKRFLSSPKGFSIDRNNQSVYLAAMLQPRWYGKEFISRYGTVKKFKDQIPAVRAVLNFATNYIPKNDVFFLERENYYIKYIKYDWRLNK